MIKHKWIYDNSHYISFLLIFFLFFLLLTPLGAFSNWINPSDHTGYYSITRIDPGDDTRIHAYLRSMVIDGDIDFFNEKELWDRFGLTSTGYNVDFMYAIGSSLLWLPFFLVGHIIAHIYSWLGYPVTTDGYSFPYLVMTGIGSATYLFLGVILCYDLLKNFFSERVALITANTVWLGTFLPFYAFIRSRMAHANEFFMVCLLIYVWFYIRKKLDVPIFLFFFGIVAGLLGLVRLDDLPILSFFVVDFIILFIKKYKLRDRATVKNIVKGVLAFTFIFSLILSLPFICAKIIWGNHLAIAGIEQSVQKVGNDDINPFRLIKIKLERSKRENLWDFFFSKDKGMFLSSPFWLLAFVGMFYFWKKERYWGSILLIGLSFPLILNIISTSTGFEYGNRKTTSVLPFLAFGFAAVFEYTRINHYKWKNVLICFTSILLIVWQYLQLVQHKVLLEYNHPTFITSAFANVPQILMKTPEYLLRSSSWMKLVILKNVQLQNYYDIFYIIILPALQLSAFVISLILYKQVKHSFNTDRISSLPRPLIKTTSIIFALFFIFLPFFILISNPKKTTAEINERRAFVEEIEELGLNKKHSIIAFDEYKIYYIIALRHLDNLQIEKAEKYALKSISIKPDNYQTIFLLASLYHTTGRIMVAIDTYEKVLKINPEHADAYEKLARIYYFDKKNYEKAQKYLRKFVSINPNNFQTKFMLAHSYHETNRIMEAINMYEEVLRINPGHAITYKNLGIIYFAKKNYTKALFNLRKCIALAPQQDEVTNIKIIIKHLSDQIEKKEGNQ